MSPEVLEAIKSLVRLLLERERQQLDGIASARASADLMLRLKTIPSQALLSTIKRNRLACLMQADPLVGELLPEIQSRLKDLGRVETMAALALASLTRETAVLFEQNAIPMLVIKGIPLAIQTTGSITSRGRGDLDLFVDPKRLGEAVELLVSVGFTQSHGASLHGEQSQLGRYSRFVDMELSMHRHHGLGTQWIDLHWHVSHIRGVLPGFNGLWSMRTSVSIGNQEVQTLALHDAFIHACCHAATDRWMCLRNLVDVERLSRRISAEKLFRLGCQKVVQKTCLVAYDLIDSPSLNIISARANQLAASRVLLDAREQQLLPWRSCLGSSGWTIKSRFKFTIYRLRLSHGFSHWLSVIFGDVMPTALLIDPQAGRQRSLLWAFKARFLELTARFKGREKPRDLLMTQINSSEHAGNQKNKTVS